MKLSLIFFESIIFRLFLSRTCSIYVKVSVNLFSNWSQRGVLLKKKKKKMQKCNFGLKQRKKNQMNYKWHLYPVLISHIPNITSPRIIITQLLNQIHSSPDSISYLKKCDEGISLVAKTEEIYNILLQAHGFIIGGQKLWIFRYPYEFEHSESALHYIFTNNYNSNTMDLSGFLSKYNSNPDPKLPSISLDDQNFIDFLFYRMALFCDNSKESIMIKTVNLSKNDITTFNADRINTFIPTIETIDLRENSIEDGKLFKQNTRINILINTKKQQETKYNQKPSEKLQPKPLFTASKTSFKPKLGNLSKLKTSQLNSPPLSPQLEQKLQQQQQNPIYMTPNPYSLNNTNLNQANLNSPIEIQQSFQQIPIIQQQPFSQMSPPQNIQNQFTTPINGQQIIIGAQPQVILQPNQQQPAFSTTIGPQQISQFTNQQPQVQQYAVLSPQYVIQPQPTYQPYNQPYNQQFVQVPVNYIPTLIPGPQLLPSQNGQMAQVNSPAYSSTLLQQPTIPNMATPASYNSNPFQAHNQQNTINQTQILPQSPPLFSSKPIGKHHSHSHGHSHNHSHGHSHSRPKTPPSFGSPTLPHEIKSTPSFQMNGNQ